ncbi:MAG: hypothetical protein H0V62_01025 [Gammaproteobacteria bacterium]|nr:hypothetical protein [Gammaproteobacteria bacterium]
MRWLGAIVLLAGCAAPPSTLPVTGELAGQAIETTVDSRIARYYLEHYIAGEDTDSELDTRIAVVEKRTRRADFTRENLRELSARFSPDFATLLFTRQLLRQDSNRRLHRAVQRENERLLSALAADKPLPEVSDPGYTLLFAPGWFYATTDSGADFARQRETLTRMGYDARLIETQENGTVEDNAVIIADTIRRFSPEARDIILVSVSKGGPEAAFALGHLLEPHETRRVGAWINVGGLLRGTPLANRAFEWPTSWLARAYFLYKGWDMAGVASLTGRRSDARLRRIHMPAHLFVLNYVGAPLSGQVLPGRTSDNFSSMRQLGPNDGLTLLVDELVLGGATLVEPGLDHYFLDPLIDLKTAALARVVIDRLEKR